MAKKISLRKHLVLSFVASSMLYNQAIALPQGGNFIQGSGSITSSGSSMTINSSGSTGSKNVINWGGGFNIGSNETVNFTGTGHQSFLNLDYSKNSSKIYGRLEGNGHDIFLVNPNGTVIGNGAVINTGKFAVSTSAMSQTEINKFVETGQFSPVFSANQKGTITIAGDAILDVSNLELVGNQIVLKDSVNVTAQSIKANAQSILLQGGTLETSTVTLNTIADSTVDGEITLSGTSFKSLQDLDLDSKIISFQSNLDLSGATLSADAEQINLNANLSASTLNFNATNKITTNETSKKIQADNLSLKATNSLELAYLELTATQTALLESNFIDLANATLTASDLTLKATGENSLINVSNSNLEAENAFELSADQAKISGGILTSKGETTKINVNDKIAFENNQLDISNSATITAGNQITFSNSTLNNQNENSTLTLSATNESGVISINESDFSLNSFTLNNTNQAKIDGSTIHANSLDFDLNDKIIVSGSTFDNVSNLDWNAKNYISLNDSEFNFTGSDTATFTANQTKISNTQMQGANNLTFSGSGENSIIEVDGSTNIENINSVKFDADRINIKSGKIQASQILELISDYLDITGGTLTSNGTAEGALKLEGKNYLGVTNANISANNGTLSLLTQNLIELKDKAILNAKNIEFKESDGTTSDTQINIVDGATIENAEKLDILLDRINVTGGTLSAKELKLEGKQITITGGEFEGTTITLSGDELVSINGENVQIGLDDTTTLTLKSGNLIEVKKGTLTAGKISMEAVDNDADDGKNRGTVDLLGGTITAKTSDIIITARDVNFGGANLSATNTISATASNLISVSNGELTAGVIKFDSTKEIDISGGELGNGENGANITLNTEGQFNVTGGTITANALEATVGAIDFKNANLKAGSVTFNATNSIKISQDEGQTTKIEASSLILNSASLIDISGGSLISTSDAITFNNNETLNNQDTTQEVIISGGTINANSGTLTVNADGIHISGGDIDATDLSLLASNDISISGENTKIDATNITLEGLGAEGGISIENGTITATALLKLLANNTISITGGTIVSTGSEDGDLSINANNIVLNGGTLESSKDLSLEASNSLDIQSGNLKVENGKLLLDGGKEVKISGATFTTSKENTTLEVKSSGKVTYNNANILTINNFTIESDEIDIQGGTIDAKGEVKFTSNTNITFKNATLTTEGGITFTAEKGIIVGSEEGEGTTKLTASGIEFNSKNIQIAKADLSAAGGDITLTATAVKNEEGTYQEGGIIEISDTTLESSGTIGATGYDITITNTNTTDTNAAAIAITAENILTINGNSQLITNNTIDLKATAKLYINGATLSAQGNLSLLSANLIELNNAKLTTNGAISFAKIDENSGLIDGENGTKLGVVATITGESTITASGTDGNIDFKVDKVDIQDQAQFTASGNFSSSGEQFYMNGGSINASGVVDIDANNYISLSGGSITGKTLDFLSSNIIDMSSITMESTGGDITIIATGELNGGSGIVFKTQADSEGGSGSGDVVITSPSISMEDPDTTGVVGDYTVKAEESLTYTKFDSYNHTSTQNITLIGTNYLGIFNSTIEGLNISFISNNFIEVQNSSITSINGGNIEFSAVDSSNSHDTKISIINSIITSAGNIAFEATYLIIKGEVDLGEGVEGSGNATSIIANGGSITTENVKEIFIENANLSASSEINLNGSALLRITDSILNANSLALSSANWIDIAGGSFTAKSEDIVLDNGEDENAKVIDIDSGAQLTANTNITFNAEQINISSETSDEIPETTISATSGDIALNAAKLIRISGGKFNANAITLSAINGVELTGAASITANGALKFLSDSLINIEGGDIDANGISFQDTNANDNTSKLAINLIGGDINAGTGIIDLDANTVNITNATLSGASIDFTVAAMLLNGTGSLNATNALTINASDNIQIQNGTLTGGTLTLISQNLINISGGSLTSNTGAITLDATNNINISGGAFKGESLEATADYLNLKDLQDPSSENSENPVFNISGTTTLTGKQYLGITGSTLSFTSLSLVSNNLIEIANSTLSTTSGAFTIKASDTNSEDNDAGIKITDSILNSNLNFLELEADIISLSGATSELNAQNAIDLTAQQILANDIKQIKSTAGDISLNASNYLKITGDTARTLIEGLNIDIIANNLVEITKADLTASAGNIDITATDTNSEDEFGTKIVLNDANLDANSNNTNDNGAAGNINIQGFDQINVEGGSVLDAAYEALLSANEKINISENARIQANDVTLKGGIIHSQNSEILADNSINFSKADGASEVNVQMDSSTLTTGENGASGSIILGASEDEISTIIINGGTINTADLDAFAKQIAIAESANITANLLDLSASELLKISGGTINVSSALTMKNADDADNVYINISGGEIKAENAALDLDAKFIDFANASITANSLDANAYVLNVASGTFTISEALKFTGSNYIDITGGIFEAKNIDFISNNVISIADASLTANAGNINISATKSEDQEISTKVDIANSTLTATGSDDNGKLTIGADTINISGASTKLSGANSVSINANSSLALSNLITEALKGNITLQASDSLKITDSTLDLTSLALLSDSLVYISGSSLTTTGGDIQIQGIGENGLASLVIENSTLSASADLSATADKIYASGTTTEFTSGTTLNFIATSLILDGIKSITSGDNVVLSGSNVVQIKGGDTKMDLNFNGNLVDIKSNNAIEISNADIDMTRGTLRINATDTNSDDDLGTKISIENSEIDIKEVSNDSYGHIEVGADQINVTESTLSADNKVQLAANSKLVLDTVTATAGLNMIFKGLTAGISAQNSKFTSSGDVEFLSNHYIGITDGSIKSNGAVRFYDTAENDTALVLDGVTIGGISEDSKPTSVSFENDSTKISGGSITATKVQTSENYLARFELLESASITADIINLHATNYLNIASGTSLTGGAITLNAANVATLAGSIIGESITVAGGTTGNIDIAGTLKSTSGVLDITGADIIIKNGASLTSSDGLSLDASNQIQIGEDATNENQPSLSAANGTITLEGTNQILVNSGVLNAGSLVFTSQNLIDLQAGTITATNGGITFTANGGKTTDESGAEVATGTITLGGVEITAENSSVKFTGEQLNINGASVNANSIIAQMENKISATSGSFTASTIEFIGKNEINLDGSTSEGSAGFSFAETSAIDLISDNLITLNAMKLSADTTIDLESNQINIKGGSLTATTGALTIDATSGTGNTGGKIVVSGGTTFSGNTVDFSARNDITINSSSTITATTSVQMLAGNWISLDGVTISGTSFKIAGISDSDTLNLIELKNVTANDGKLTTIDLAATDITLDTSDLDASGAITADASGNLNIKDSSLVSSNGAIALSGDKSITVSQSEGTTTIEGISLSFTSQNLIDLKAGTITATNGNIELITSSTTTESEEATGTIKFAGANVSAQGTDTSAENAEKSTAGSIYANGEQVNISAGTITANTDFKVNAENIARMTGGKLNVKNQLTLDGKNRVEVTGGELGTDINDLVFLTERHIKLGIDIDTDNLTLEGEQITLGNKEEEGAAITIDADSLTLKALKNSGIENEGGIVELLNATLNISNSLDIQARNNISFTDALINASTANVSLLAQNNNISITGGSISANALTMQAKNVIDLSNTSVNVSGNENALYIGGVDNTTDSKAQQVNITNSGISAQNGITINASNKIKVSGTNTTEHYLKGNSGKITLNGGEQINISGITVGATGIDFKAQGTVGRIDLSNTEIWAKNQSVSLQANEGINIIGGFIKQNTSVDFDAQDIELTSTNLESTGKIDLNALNQLIIDSTTLNAGTADITLEGANQILVKGTSSIAGQNLSFISTNLIDLQGGDITATNGDITLTASGGTTTVKDENGEESEVATGTIKFGGANITATTTSDQGGDITANAEQVNISAGSVEAENFHAKGNNQVVMTGANLDISEQLILEGTEKVSVTDDAELGTQINDLVFLSKKYIELGIDINVENLTLRAQQIRLNGGTFDISGNFYLDAGDTYNWTDAPSEDLKGTQTIEGNQGVVKITDGAIINAGTLTAWGKNWVYVDGDSTITADNVNFYSDNLIELANANINSANIDFDAGKAIVIGDGSVLQAKDGAANLTLDLNAASILLGYTLTKEKDSEDEWSEFTAEQDSEGVNTQIIANTITLKGNSENSGLIQFGGNLDLDATTSLTTSLVKDILVEGKADLNAATLQFLASNLIRISGGSISGTSATFNENSTGDVEISDGSITSSTFTVNADDIIVSGGTINNANLDFNAGNVIEISNGNIDASTQGTFDASNQITLNGGILGGVLKFTANGTSDTTGKIVFNGATIDATKLDANAKQIDIQSGILSADTLNLIASNLIDLSGGTLGEDGDTLTLQAQKIAVANVNLQGAKADLIAQYFTLTSGSILANAITIKDSAEATMAENETGTVAEISGGTLGADNSVVSMDFDRINVSGDTTSVKGSSIDFDTKQITIENGTFTADTITLKASEKIALSGGTFHGITNGTNTLKLLSDNLVQISGGTFDIKNTIIGGISTLGDSTSEGGLTNSSLTELIISGGTFNKNLNAYAKNINFKSGSTVTFTDSSNIGATSKFNASNMIKFDSASISSDNNDLTFNAKDIELNSGAFTSTNAANLAFDATNSINVNGTTFTNDAKDSSATFTTTGENAYIGFVNTNITGFSTVNANSSQGLELDKTTINTATLNLTSAGNTVIENGSNLTTSSSLDLDAKGDLKIDGSTLTVNGSTSDIDATGDLVFNGSTLTTSANTNTFNANNILLNDSSLNFDSTGATFTAANGTFQSTNSSMILISGVTVNANANDIIISGAKGDGDSIELRGGSTINLTANDALKIENAKFGQLNANDLTNSSQINKYNFQAGNHISVNGAQFDRSDIDSKLGVSFKTTADDGSIDLTNVNNVNEEATGDNTFTLDSNLVEFKGSNNLTNVSTGNTNYINFSGENNTITNSTLTANDKIDFVSGSSSTLSNSTLDADKLINVAGSLNLSGTTFKSSGNIESEDGAAFTLSGTNNFYAAYQKYTGTSFSGSGSTLNFKGYDGSAAATKIEFQTGTNFSNISTINANATGILVDGGTVSNVTTIDFDASSDLQITNSNLSATNVNLYSAYLYIKGGSLTATTLNLNTADLTSAYTKLDGAKITAGTLIMGKDNKSGSVIDILNSSTITSNTTANLYADAIHLANSLLILSGASNIKALTQFTANGGIDNEAIRLSGNLTIDGGKEIEFSNSANINKSGDSASMWLRTSNAGDNGVISITGSRFGNSGDSMLDKIYIVSSDGSSTGANDLLVDNSSLYANDMKFDLANRVDVTNNSNLFADSMLYVKGANNVDIENSTIKVTNATTSGAGIFGNYINFNGSTFTLTGGTFSLGDSTTKYLKIENSGDSKGFWVNGTTAATLNFEGEKIDFKGQLTTNYAAQTINFDGNDINFDGADFTVNGSSATINIGTTDAQNITLSGSTFTNKGTMSVNMGSNSTTDKIAIEGATFADSGTLNLDLKAKANASDLTSSNGTLQNGEINLSGLVMTNEIDSLTANANQILIANGSDIKASSIDLSSPGNMIMTGGTVTADTFTTSSGAGTGMVFLQGGNLNANTITLGGKEVQILASDKQNKGTEIHAKNGTGNVGTVNITAVTGYVNASNVYADTINNQNDGWISMDIDALSTRGSSPEMTGNTEKYLNIATSTTATANASQWYQFVSWLNSEGDTHKVDSYDQYNLLNDIDFSNANLADEGTYGIIESLDGKTFNGYGHTLNNFRIGVSSNGSYYSEGNTAGLILEATNSTFQNLVINNSWVNVNGSIMEYVGLLVGKASSGSVFNNIKIQGNSGINTDVKTVTTSNIEDRDHLYVGGIAGVAVDGATFENIDVSGLTINAKSAVKGIFGQMKSIYVGGAVGQIYGETVLDHIYLTNLTLSAEGYRAFAAGFAGIIGSSDKNVPFNAQISNIVINNIKSIGTKATADSSTGAYAISAGFTTVPLTSSTINGWVVTGNNIYIDIDMNKLSYSGDTTQSGKSAFIGSAKSYSGLSSSSVGSTLQDVHIYTGMGYEDSYFEGWIFELNQGTSKAEVHESSNHTSEFQSMISSVYGSGFSGFYSQTSLDIATPSSQYAINTSGTTSSIEWNAGSSKTGVTTDLTGKENSTEYKESCKNADDTTCSASANDASAADISNSESISVSESHGNYQTADGVSDIIYTDTVGTIINSGTTANSGIGSIEIGSINDLDNSVSDTTINTVDDKGTTVSDILGETITSLEDSVSDTAISDTSAADKITIGDITSASDTTQIPVSDNTNITDITTDANYNQTVGGDVSVDNTDLEKPSTDTGSTDTSLSKDEDGKPSIGDEGISIPGIDSDDVKTADTTEIATGDSGSEGSIKVNVPEYVAIGEDQDTTPDAITEEDDIKIGDTGAPSESEGIWDITYKDIIAGEFGDIIGSNVVADNTSIKKDITKSEADSSTSVGGADDTTDKGYDLIKISNGGSSIAISNDDTVNTNSDWTEKNFADSEYTFTANSVDDKGNVILDENDFDSAILNGILENVKEKFLELDISELELALEYLKAYNESLGSENVDLGALDKLAGILGLEGDSKNTFIQGLDFLNAFYGTKGAGDLLASFGGDLAQFDTSAKEFKDIAQSVQEDSFGSENQGNYSGGILGDYNEFSQDLDEYKNLENQINALIDDLKNKYEVGSDAYENAYSQYESLKSQMESLKEKLQAASEDIKQAIEDVLTKSNGHFSIIDSEGILNVSGLSVPNYNKEEAEEEDDEGPNSRLFAEDNIYDENEESSTSGKKGEIDEAAGKQKARLCIVSDNAKAMNPCLAMGN